MRYKACSVVLFVATLAGCGGGGGGTSDTGGGGGDELNLGSMSISVQGKPASKVASTGSTFNVIGLAGASFSKVQFNLPPITQANAEQVRKATYIAYGGFSRAMMYSYATGESYRLIPAELPYQVVGMDFFPNGRKLALLVSSTAGYEIATVNADGSGFAIIAPTSSFGFGISVSPTGSKIVVVHNANGYPGLMTMNPDGSGKVQITTGSSAGYDTNPDWMSNGRIAFLRNSAAGQRVNSINADGTNPSDLSGIDQTLFALAVSPSATMKAYYASSGGSWYIRTTPLVGTATYYQSPAISGAGQICWSPDGNQLLYAAPVDGVYALYISDLGLTPDRPLFLSSYVPAWGPYIQKWVFVGNGGLLLPASAGFLFTQGGSDMNSLVAFDATTRTSARITNLDPGNGTQSLVYDVTADMLKSLKYTNALTGQPVMVINPTNSATYAKGAIVSFDPQTGRVASVITHDAVGAAPQLKDRTRLTGSFLEMWDAKGGHRSLQGVKELRRNPATGAISQ